MPIEHDLQAALAAAPHAHGQMLIDPDLVRSAEIEITRLRRELDELMETIPAAAPGIRV